MSRAHGLLVLMAGSCACLIGCGSRSSVASSADAASCPMPAAFVSQSCRFSSARCVLEGVDQLGARYELSCDGSTCTFARDGRHLCDCERLDHANVGPGGFPLCAAWRPPFNFATLECVRE